MKRTSESNAVRPVIAVIAIVIVLIVGALVYRRDHGSARPVPVFKTQVDRGLSPENQIVMQKKIDDQKALIAETEKNGPRDISQYLILGNFQYGIGDLAEAAKTYRVILQALPNDAPSLQNLGQVQSEAGDYAGAEISWRASLKSEPDAGYYLRIADLIDQHVPERRGDIGALLEDAIRSVGQTQNLVYRLGQWYEQQGKFTEALSHYGVAYQLSGQDPSIKQTMDEVQEKISALQAK